MYREILTNKWILGGLCFLVVFAGVCYLYYQHETTSLKQQATEPNEIIQQTAEIANPTEAAADAPVGSITPNTEKPINETIDVVKGDTFPSETHANLTEQTQETENAEEVPVSPHGFGPFPEVPDDYFTKPFSWDFFKNDPPIYELMERVLIKLWKQGIRTTGIVNSSADGLVYPTIPGAVFVKRYNRDGINYLEIRGDPDYDLEAIKESLMAGDVRDGVTVRDFDEAGIDPYTFLNLKK